MRDLETRFTEMEFRASDGPDSPGTVVGIALRYGDTAELAPGLREVFEPGAFGDLGTADVILNSMHKREQLLARTLGGGLELRNSVTALEVEARLPATTLGRDTAALLASRVLKGLSIEFRCKRDTLAGGLRTVHEAILTGVAVCDRAAYGQSLAALQTRMHVAELWHGWWLS